MSHGKTELLIEEWKGPDEGATDEESDQKSLRTQLRAN